ncbi:hypothetical protein DsansV1_C07g0075971 [Dioscorea sansibarensis]
MNPLFLENIRENIRQSSSGVRMSKSTIDSHMNRIILSRAYHATNSLIFFILHVF